MFSAGAIVGGQLKKTLLLSKYPFLMCTWKMMTFSRRNPSADSLNGTLYQHTSVQQLMNTQRTKSFRKLNIFFGWQHFPYGWFEGRSASKSKTCNQNRKMDFKALVSPDLGGMLYLLSPTCVIDKGQSLNVAWIKVRSFL